MRNPLLRPVSSFLLVTSFPVVTKAFLFSKATSLCSFSRVTFSSYTATSSVGGGSPSDITTGSYSCSRKMSTSNRGDSPIESTGVSSLPPLLDSEGKRLSPDQCTDRFAGRRVAYYFSAGWCPMCLSFEPSLLQFRQAAKDSGKDLELIYVPSDRSADDAIQRGGAMGMPSVPFGEDADELKKTFGIWAGVESSKLGNGRRSGVPALVVLDNNQDEMAFLPAEAEGVAALKAWPLDEVKGVW